MARQKEYIVTLGEIAAAYGIHRSVALERIKNGLIKAVGTTNCPKPVELMGDDLVFSVSKEHEDFILKQIAARASGLIPPVSDVAGSPCWKELKYQQRVRRKKAKQIKRMRKANKAK